MSFTTLPFLVLVALSVAAYYLLPQRVQWMALLAASMVFYCMGGGQDRPLCLLHRCHRLWVGASPGAVQ